MLEKRKQLLIYRFEHFAWWWKNSSKCSICIVTRRYQKQININLEHLNMSWLAIFKNLPCNSGGKWDAQYNKQDRANKEMQIYGNNISPCPIKTRKLQWTCPPFFQTILPTFWRLLGCWLWVDRFVRAPCRLKAILCAANDLWTQKNLTLPLVQIAGAQLIHTTHDSTLC